VTYGAAVQAAIIAGESVETGSGSAIAAIPRKIAIPTIPEGKGAPRLASRPMNELIEESKGTDAGTAAA